LSALLLASRSPDKLREIREILPNLSILSLEEAGVPVSAEEERIEAFDTFLENARAKAEWFGRAADLPILADDSGLCVDALGGAPGVLSRRFSGRSDLTGSELDDANNRALLARLAGIPGERRGAAYVCAAVLRRRDGHVLEALGSVRGRISEEPGGTGGFGYDPLFRIPQLDRSFGEIPASLKHRFSHRARAFRALASQLESFLGG
jgi:XTP/dITP diphosphohydrolase